MKDAKRRWRSKPENKKKESEAYKVWKGRNTAKRQKYMKKYNKEYREKNRERLSQVDREKYDPDKAYDGNLRRRYGITLDDYKALLTRQNGVCALCNQSEKHKLRGKTKRLAVDHCHKTGKVRGLLCGQCNRNLGLFGDDPNRLESAAKYLRGI